MFREFEKKNDQLLDFFPDVGTYQIYFFKLKQNHIFPLKSTFKMELIT